MGVGWLAYKQPFLNVRDFCSRPPSLSGVEDLPTPGPLQRSGTPGGAKGAAAAHIRPKSYFPGVTVEPVGGALGGNSLQRAGEQKFTKKSADVRMKSGVLIAMVYDGNLYL